MAKTKKLMSKFIGIINYFRKFNLDSQKILLENVDEDSQSISSNQSAYDAKPTISKNW